MTPEEIEGALKIGGHRLTHSRRVVVRELERSRHFLSAEEVHERIKQEHPEVSLSTVYRTLNLLKRLGIARRKGLGDGRARYGLRADKPTQLARCEFCEATIEFSEELTDYLALQVRHDTGFVADSSELTLHGRCAACAAAHEPEARLMLTNYG